jgi:hypothetical protein
MAMGKAEWITLGLVGAVAAVLYSTRTEAAPPATTTPAPTGRAALLAEGSALAAKAEADPTTITDQERSRMAEIVATLGQQPQSQDEAALAVRLLGALSRVQVARGGAPLGPFGGGAPTDTTPGAVRGAMLVEAQNLLAKVSASPQTVTDAELDRMRRLALTLGQPSRIPQPAAEATLPARLQDAVATVLAARASTTGGGGIIPPPGGTAPTGGGTDGGVTKPAPQDTQPPLPSGARPPIPPIIQAWQARLIQLRTDPRSVDVRTTQQLIDLLRAQRHDQEANMLASALAQLAQKRPAPMMRPL